ncbi:DUF2620 family protein [Cellulomonas denverensis]|uniref:DUF2620 family protein n=1 Tax=Cellulomonas denverensis TaxID=264297 RepID=A0A7X6KXD4_9CELL|nr:DUF2620 family protein [Cellulomonas denverensis]NKY23961.1 DUF2620 family protein [Cellulomonas denverensis]GIG24916.1 hypothetical protein Cde04nite_11600 [Cellulomonas denverensis]
MKIITGGVGRAQVADLLRPLLAAGDEVVTGSDMDAAMALRTGRADYYLGTCHTGAGASLGVLVGLLGAARCHTFGRGVPSRDAVTAALDEGAVALGFAIDQIDELVPVVWQALDARR